MKRTLTIVLAVLGLVLASCSSGDAETDASGQLGSESAAETETDDGDTEDGGRGDDAEPSADDAGSDDGGDDTGTADGSDGGAGDETAGSAGATNGTLGDTVLGRALDRTEAVNSARFEGTMELDGLPDSDLPGRVAIEFEGAFDTAADASRLTMDMGALFEAAMAADPEAADGFGAMFSAMFEEPMEVITIGDQSWIQWGLLAMFGVEDKWLETTAADGASMGMTELGGADSPTSLLRELADADATVTEVGREDIRGVSTTHHRAELDLATLAESMTPAERAEFEQTVGVTEAEGTYVLDLWIDDGDLLHRFELTVSDIPDTPETDGLAGIAFVYDLWDHGLELNIAPPPADQIVTEEELGLSMEDLGAFGS